MNSSVLLKFSSLSPGNPTITSLEMLMPVHHARSREDADRYRVEPYVLAADIYVGDHAGRGGWTWYTGSAGWCLQAATEILGIGFSQGELTVKPRLPREMRGYRAQVNCGGRVYRIRVENGINSQ